MCARSSTCHLATAATTTQQALSELSASKQPLREAWTTWNPQRAAAKELQQQIEAGNLTLEVSVVVRQREYAVMHVERPCMLRKGLFKAPHLLWIGKSLHSASILA